MLRLIIITMLKRSLLQGKNIRYSNRIIQICFGKTALFSFNRISAAVQFQDQDYLNMTLMIAMSLSILFDKNNEKKESRSFCGEEAYLLFFIMIQSTLETLTHIVYPHWVRATRRRKSSKQPRQQSTKKINFRIPSDVA